MKFVTNYFIVYQLILFFLKLSYVTPDTIHPQFFINRNELSITNIVYNPDSTYSSWVNYTFGENAVFYQPPYDRKVNQSTKSMGKEKFRNFFRVYDNEEIFNPKCSIELSGFVPVGLEAPILYSYRNEKPSIGRANLIFPYISSQENRRLEENTDYSSVRYHRQKRGRRKKRKQNVEPIKQEPEVQSIQEQLDSSMNQTHNIADDDLLLSFFPDEAAKYKTKWTNSSSFISAMPKIKTMPNSKGSLIFSCYYRGMYENTMPDTPLLPLQYWSILFFCPSPSEEKCLQLNYLYDSLQTPSTNFHSEESYTLPKLLSFPSVSELKSIYKSGLENGNKFLPLTQLSKSPKNSDFFPSTNGFIPLRNYNNFNDVTLKPLPMKIEMFMDPTDPFVPIDFSLTSSSSKGYNKKWELNTHIDLIINQAVSISSSEQVILTTFPYTTSNPVKRDMNLAIFFEFLSYYLSLNVTIFVFDSFGKALTSLEETEYAKYKLSFFKKFNLSINNKFSSEWLNQKLYYYNYTIFTFFYSVSHQFLYDNNEGINNIMLKTDLDKKMTLTHGRFLIKQMLRTNNVLVVDPDEFLFCPRLYGAFTPNQYVSHMQKQWNYLSNYSNIEEIYFKQVTLEPQESNITNCILRQIHFAQEFWQKQIFDRQFLPSIFLCQSSYLNKKRVLFPKSFHFQHHCPYTTFHYAHFGVEFDCEINSTVFLTPESTILSRPLKTYFLKGTDLEPWKNFHECGLIHFELRERLTISTQNKSQNAKKEIERGRYRINELYHFLKA